MGLSGKTKDEAEMEKIKAQRLKKLQAKMKTAKQSVKELNRQIAEKTEKDPAFASKAMVNQIHAMVNSISSTIEDNRLIQSMTHVGMAPPVQGFIMDVSTLHSIKAVIKMADPYLSLPEEAIQNIIQDVYVTAEDPDVDTKGHTEPGKKEGETNDIRN